MISATFAAWARRRRRAVSASAGLNGADRSERAWPSKLRLSDALKVAKRTGSVWRLSAATGGADTTSALSRRSSDRSSAAGMRASRATDRDMWQDLRWWWVVVIAAEPAPATAIVGQIRRL